MNEPKELINLQSATLQFGDHTVWSDLSLSIAAGEFVAVLGPNGSGKSSLLKVLLGQYMLDEGTVSVHGSIGYVPQQQTFDIHVPLTGRDLVALGLTGTKWGFGGLGQRARAIDDALRAVNAHDYARKSLGQLSGGQQQRLRVAQALVSSPSILLCDEPLLSLDLASQRAVTDLINQQRTKGAAVLFVTHEVNPILPFVDRLLYVVNGKWQLGTPDEILNSKTLSSLYGTDVDVLQVRDRIIVVAGDDAPDAHVHHQEAHHD